MEKFSMFQGELDITQINSRFYILGQCWKNRTEIYSERNNSKNIKDYVDQKFGKRAMICRFGSQNTLFNNELWYDLPEFNISYAYSVAKAVHGWLKFNPENIILFEIKGNIQKFLFIASCTLKFTKYFLNSNDACEYIINTRYKKNKRISCTLKRYLEYYDNLDLTKTKKQTQNFILKQIIAMKYPTFDVKDVKPFFEIKSENYKKEYNDIKMLIDKNYIIGEFRDLKIKGDCVIKMFYNERLKNHPVFEIYLNTLFLQESLYRYKKGEIFFPLSEFIVNTKVNNEFMVDIVLINDQIEEKSLYNIDTSLPCCLKTLSEHMKNEADHFELKKLIQEGYNRLYSKIYLQLNYTYDQTVKILKNISDKKSGIHSNCSKLQINKGIIFETNKFDNTPISTCTEDKTFKSNMRPFSKRAYLNENTHQNVKITALEYLKDHIVIKRSEEKSKRNFPFLRRSLTPKPKIVTTDFEQNNSKIFVKKPLHWNIITNTNQTFFENAEKIKIPLDLEKFEEWFCEPLVKQTTEKYVTKKSIIKDEQRLFLVSISLKTLEKKNIDIYDLEGILSSKSFDLTFEDLQNILRVLPTESEMNIFKEFKKNNPSKSALAELNSIEQILLINMDSFELTKLIKILMFERKFIDDYEHVEKILKNLKLVYYKILDSKNLRIFLKVLLDIGNLINFTYSKSKTRISAQGFKIMSLQTMSRYNGIKVDNKLTNFLFDTLKKTNPNVFAIFEELRELKTIKNETIEPIKKNINTMIKEFNDSQNQLIEIDDRQIDNHSLKHFLVFAYEKLKYFADIYKEILIVMSMIKRMFGEDDEINFNEILVTLHDFLIKIEEDYKIHHL